MDSYLLNLPLGVKIPVKPKSNTVFCRGKLGEKLHGPCPFNFDDPYIRCMSLQYNCLHDPHLRDYHKRKDILRMLKRQGVITSDNKRSKETSLMSGKLRKGKIDLDKGQTYPRAALGTAADSQKKMNNTADGLFKAVFEQLTAAEAQKIQELVETVVHEVFGRLRVPREHYVNFLRRAARRIRGIVFSGCMKTETSLDHRQEMEMVAKELVVKVLEILGNRLESKVSKPGRAAGRKEKPVDGRAIRTDKSKDAETDRAHINACLDKLTRQVVKNVHCLLKSMVASQFEGDSSCECTEIPELPKGKVSNRQMQLRFFGESGEQSQEANTGVKLPALERQLHAEWTGYPKTMEPKNPAVKESLVRRRNPATSGKTLDIRIMATRIVQSLLDQIGQHWPAPTLRQNFQEPIQNPATSQGGEESCADENTLPSVDPKFSQQPIPPEDSKFSQQPIPPEDPKFSQQPIPPEDPKFSQQPIPPEDPKPPAQAGARCRSVHAKFV
ncbi:uncharacterized protein FYW23_009509 isoform 2-T2 [Sylvia borin]